jgi:large subunit ribosomal protein L16
MLVPKKTKYRKFHRTSYDGKAKGAKTLNFGSIGLKAESGCWLTTRQIEAARRAIAGYTKREGKIWIRVFPHMGYSRKPLEQRMGGGKGPHEGYLAVVKKGTIIFEMDGVSEKIAKEALRLASHKLPIKTKMVFKETGEENGE